MCVCVCVQVCSLLLTYGADPNFLNCHNKCSIDLAPTSQLKERLARTFTPLQCV